jgi:hypothetical protein
MHLRQGLLIPWAMAAALVVLVGFTPAAAASVGVGVQANPVRLGKVARPGNSYALPAVFVINTGSQPETITLRVERLSHGPGRAVPPSWVHLGGPAVHVPRHRGARISLQLVVPGGARPGAYLSDIVASGSATVTAGGARLGAAAATKLEFRVAAVPAAGMWSSVTTWLLWTMALVFLVAVAVFAVRRSGLRIKVERRPASYGTADQQGGWNA